MSDRDTAGNDVNDVEEAEPLLLAAPEDGVPPITDTPEGLDDVVERFRAGTGPVAVDAERASGFRYGQRTYLAQFKREGAGIALIDTDALPDLSGLSHALLDAEWVLHAASQDLPGLHELNMKPGRVFDTELAARLLGWPKVGLASVVERELGFALAKEHSAQDWSERPIPAEWLAYAALDVELLLDLRVRLGRHLEAAGKAEWAEQEFEAVRNAPPSAPRPDPWRHTSGTHKLRDRRALAIVRELWNAREEVARAKDTAPGRILRDAAIVAAALAKPASLASLIEVPEWRSKGTKRKADRWYPAIEKALALPDTALPTMRGPGGDGPPPPRLWSDKRPEADTRLKAAKAVVARLVERHAVPAENLLQPDALRRLCWEYQGGGRQAIERFLEGRGARPWQICLVAEPLAKAWEAIRTSEQPPGDLA
ncbi:MAG: HRDC domain-containing protein [Demequinaceae bacterium]|nr:HRDC domain-containing protein [Demequinaceae bacterium]